MDHLDSLGLVIGILQKLIKNAPQTNHFYWGIIIIGKNWKGSVWTLLGIRWVLVILKEIGVFSAAHMDESAKKMTCLTGRFSKSLQSESLQS